MIKLRPHHLFCTTLFSGNGYNEEFTKNMSEIIAKLPNKQIKIVSKHDDLCKKCPNNGGEGICLNSKDNVRTRDKTAMDELQINENKLYNYKELLIKLSNIDEQQYNNVCDNCQWKIDGFCSYVILKHRITSIT